MPPPSNATSAMTESSLYATARHVFYAESFLALAFSALFVVALRTAGSAASFRKHKAKGAFRLALLGVALGDFVQSSSVLAYVFDLRPNDPRRTTHSTPACALGAVVSSTGEIASALFTACLAVEGYLILVRGVRTGERRRALAYVTSVGLILLSVQAGVGAALGFGNTEPDNKSGNYVWCSTEIRTHAGEVFSFYLWLILALSVSLVCYLRLECKLRSMLKAEGIDDATKRTIQRSRCKFFSFPIIFILAWLPTGVHRVEVWFRKNTEDSTSTSQWVLLYVSALTAGGLPIMNGIMYMYSNKEVREDLERLWKRCLRCCCFAPLPQAGDGARSYSGGSGSARASFGVVNYEGGRGGDYSGDDSDSSDDGDLPPATLYDDYEGANREEGLLDSSVFSPPEV
jgi:hypothetical protein